MGFARRYVFPVLWLLIAAAIAVALTKLAFFSDAPGGGTADDGAAPTANVDEWATVSAERGDIAAALELPTTVRADAGTPLSATHAGEVVEVWVKNGDAVSRGDRILQVRVPKDVAIPEPPPAPVAETDAPAAAPTAPTVPAAPASPAVEYSYHNLTAPRGGTVRDLRAVTGQSLSLGDAVATITPGTYSITADLTPEQQLQLLDTRIKATATLASGGSPFTCKAASITEDDPEQAEDAPAVPAIDPMTGMPMETANSLAQLTCAVPAGTKVVPGLTGTISVDLGSAEGVITVPVTAVEGSLEDGAVYRPPTDGNEPERHPVTLGLRDTTTVEVRTGLTEGDEILRFAPGADNPEDPVLGNGVG